MVLIDITITGQVEYIYRQHGGINKQRAMDKAFHIISNYHIHAIRLHDFLFVLSTTAKQKILGRRTPKKQEECQQQQEDNYPQTATLDTLLKSAFFLSYFLLHKIC